MISTWSETSFTAAAGAVITPDMALAEPLPEPADAPTDPETGGTLIIDLAAIAANWRVLAHQALTVECAAVVKANAYGLGLEQVTATLAKAGCKTFFVADLAEARRVRARARRHDLCARWLHAGRIAGLRRAQCAAGHQQHDRACRVGRLRRRPQLARRRRAASGHRHEPARHFAGR